MPKPAKTSQVLRGIAILALVAAGMCLQNPVTEKIFGGASAWFSLRPSSEPAVLLSSTYLLVVTVRLFWWAALAGFAYLIDKDASQGVFRRSSQPFALFLKGLGIGLLVMAGTILAIVALGDAQLKASPGTAWTHVLYGGKWLLGEVVGAAGEELLYRGLILVAVSRIAGTKAAIFVSAFAFTLGHVLNPGASLIWMIRLFAAGLLLCYSVLRTGSLWWAIGYHAGWNWMSAPFFGAAGSGYIDEGHIFSFGPAGPNWVTGGAVGPEGSVFAFLAVLLGAFLLLVTTPSAQWPGSQGSKLTGGWRRPRSRF
jgi:hypothetical protein